METSRAPGSHVGREDAPPYAVDALCARTLATSAPVRTSHRRAADANRGHSTRTSRRAGRTGSVVTVGSPGESAPVVGFGLEPVRADQLVELAPERRDQAVAASSRTPALVVRRAEAPSAATLEDEAAPLLRAGLVGERVQEERQADIASVHRDGRGRRVRLGVPVPVEVHEGGDRGGHGGAGPAQDMERRRCESGRGCPSSPYRGTSEGRARSCTPPCRARPTATYPTATWPVDDIAPAGTKAARSHGEVQCPARLPSRAPRSRSPASRRSRSRSPRTDARLPRDLATDGRWSTVTGTGCPDSLGDDGPIP